MEGKPKIVTGIITILKILTLINKKTSTIYIMEVFNILLVVLFKHNYSTSLALPVTGCLHSHPYRMGRVNRLC